MSIDGILFIWFALTVIAAAYVAYDQFKARAKAMGRSLAMNAMSWGWVVVTLYTGVFALAGYGFLHRSSAGRAPGPALWEQSVESTIHCVAGDATGILLATVVTIWLGLPMSWEVVIEYAAGFAVGLFVFQALCMASGFGGSYWQAVRSTLLAQMLSMNALMAGMIPVMVIVMSRDMSAMEPGSIRFWGTMSFALVVGTVTTYPVNRWLVQHGLKHGMGGEARARGLRDSVSAGSKAVMTLATLAMLAGGVALAEGYGDFSMRAGDSRMEAVSGQSHERVK